MFFLAWVGTVHLALVHAFSFNLSVDHARLLGLDSGLAPSPAFKSEPVPPAEGLAPFPSGDFMTALRRHLIMPAGAAARVWMSCHYEVVDTMIPQAVPWLGELLRG